MGAKGSKKQREFARKVAEGSSLTDAYADSYETNGKRETIRREASRLARNPVVAPMIEAESQAIELAELPSRASRRRWVMERLAKESEIGSDSSRIRALELIGRSVGAFDLDENESNESNESDLLASLRARLVGVLPIPIEIDVIPDDEEGDPTPP
jgi:hypothetical protein